MCIELDSLKLDDVLSIRVYHINNQWICKELFTLYDEEIAEFKQFQQSKIPSVCMFIIITHFDITKTIIILNQDKLPPVPDDMVDKWSVREDNHGVMFAIRMTPVEHAYLITGNSTAVTIASDDSSWEHMDHISNNGEHFVCCRNGQLYVVKIQSDYEYRLSVDHLSLYRVDKNGYSNRILIEPWNIKETGNGEKKER